MVSASTADSKDVDSVGSPNCNNVTKVEVSGDGGEFVILGHKKYYRHEIMAVLAQNSQSLSSKFATSTPLGLSAFAVTTLVLSLYLLQARGIKTINVAVSLATFYGGVVQTIAGIWVFFSGDTLSMYTIKFGQQITKYIRLLTELH